MNQREAAATGRGYHDQHLKVADVCGENQQAAAVGGAQGVSPILRAVETCEAVETCRCDFKQMCPFGSHAAKVADKSRAEWSNGRPCLGQERQ